jgi:hypothetical protein
VIEENWFLQKIKTKQTTQNEMDERNKNNEI